MWASVGTPAPASRLLLEPARPNPSGASASLRFDLPRAGHARLVVVDVTGRRVRMLIDGPFTAGPHEAVWNGRADDARPAPAGLSWARLQSDGATSVRKLVRMHP